MCNKKSFGSFGYYFFFGERNNKDQKSTALVMEKGKKKGKEENDTQNTDWFSKIGGLLKRGKQKTKKGKEEGGRGRYRREAKYHGPQPKYAYDIQYSTYLHTLHWSQ